MVTKSKKKTASAGKAPRATSKTKTKAKAKAKTKAKTKATAKIAKAPQAGKPKAAANPVSGAKAVSAAPTIVDKEALESEIFSRPELEHFHQLLMAERDKILAKARSAVRTGSIALDSDDMMDEVDLASATIEQNLTFRLLDRERKLLGEVERALKKIQSGDYGFCEGTGDPIPKRRLELAPWTRHSVKHKEHLEGLKKSGRGVGDEEEY